MFLLVLAVFLGGGTGAYFLVRSTQPVGHETPREAIDGFLDAVFNQHDPVRADDYFCFSDWDPDRLDGLILQVLDAQKEYEEPVTTWRVPERLTVVRGETEIEAEVTLTDNGTRAVTQLIRLTVADQRGWWVCGFGDLRAG